MQRDSKRWKARLGALGREEFEGESEATGIGTRTPLRSRGGSWEGGLEISTVGSQILDKVC